MFAREGRVISHNGGDGLEYEPGTGMFYTTTGLLLNGTLGVDPMWTHKSAYSPWG